MILVDSSIWIDHFRSPERQLERIINENRLVVHDYVIGELALGSVPDRTNLLMFLTAMPRVETLSLAEFTTFVEQQELVARGIGFVDAHLLASVASIQDTCLWTRDKRLFAQADRLGVSFRG